MNNGTLGAVLLVGLALGACQRKAIPTKSTGGPGTSVPVGPAKKAVQATNTAFRYLNAKGKAQITMKAEKQGANLNLRLRRDSIIWVSASLLGIEGVRACLTTDSVRVVNRLEKTYFAGGYDYLSKLLNVPVSYAQMQALLLGDFQPAPQGTEPTVTAENGGQRVQHSQAGTVVEQLLQATGRVQQLKISEAAAKRQLVVDYGDFKSLDGQSGLPFANTVSIQAQQEKGSTSATIDYSKVTAGDARLSFPFSIPSGYRRMK